MTEYLAENARLRQLSRRYAEGQVSFADYRAMRREILEALEAGRVQASAPVAEAPRRTPDIEATDIRLPDEPEAFYKTMPPRVAQSGTGSAVAGPAEAEGWDSPTRVLAVVLGLSLLLAVSALVYVFAL